MVEVGTIYEDPEGVWEVIAVNGHYADVKQVQEGNLNIGQVCTVTVEEVEYYLRGGK